jgi:hypothetical protein
LQVNNTAAIIASAFIFGRLTKDIILNGSCENGRNRPINDEDMGPRTWHVIRFSNHPENTEKTRKSHEMGLNMKSAQNRQIGVENDFGRVLNIYFFVFSANFGAP